MTMKYLRKIALLGTAIAISSAAFANNNHQPPAQQLSPEFINYGLNLYNYIVKNQCFMDDINTRDSSLKKSGRIIYWYNGKKRELVDAMVFRLPTNKGNTKLMFELNGQISGTYLCIKGKNFQSRYMFEDRLLRKLDKHTQTKIKNVLIKQGKLPAQ